MGSSLSLLLLDLRTYRYLQESGFVHSAFSFSHESMLGRTSLRSADKTLPPGALISFLQKGLQYVGIEENLQQQDGRNSEENDVDFSILSPPAIAAMSRKNPPIQLNVPPATAAAAVKARLQVEAKLQAEHNAAVVSSQLQANGLLNPGMQGQQVLEDPNAALARQAMAAQAAAAHMAALQQQMGGGGMPDASAVHAFAAQQQRVAAAADIMALTNQQQQLAVGGGMTSDAAATLASVASSQGVKRGASGAKRVPKKQKTSNKDDAAAAGFASLDRSEESKGSKTGSLDSGAQPMDEDNDQQAASNSRPAHSGQGTGPLPSHELANGEVDRNGASTDKRPINGSKKGGPSPKDNKDIPDDTATNANPEDILKLEMHQSEVFMCAWNPIFTDLIATGSGDASARIWQMGGTSASSGLASVKLLPHGTDPRDKKNKDVTTLEWSSDGMLLATGSYDGVARIWARNGALIHTLRGHKGPIFSLKWNKQGNYLLSGSYDKTTIVWDVSGSTGVVEQQFTDHDAPALDVDWKDNTTFASCSTDRTVHICRVGLSQPIKVYKGHTDEVNAVKWDPSGRLLASCSDDCTAKVWDMESDRTDPLYDFTSHEQEIYTVKWSPTGPGSKNPTKKAMLATASFDGSVRLWNIEDGSCYRVFSRHRDSVYSVAFSPSGDYLASGSLAGQLYIWKIAEGRHVKSYKGKGDIFEVAWNKEETRVAACFSSNVVAILDFDRKLSD